MIPIRTQSNADERIGQTSCRGRHDGLERRASAACRELTASIHSVHYAANKLCGLLALLEQSESGASLETVARNLELHAEFVVKTASEVVRSAQTLASLGAREQTLGLAWES